MYGSDEKKHGVSTITYPFKLNDANTTSKPPVTKFNPFRTVFIDRVLDGKETLSLLESSPVTQKAQWKLRSFLHCDKKLRPKLNSYSAAALISVVAIYFDFNIHVANNQAESYVETFKLAFRNFRWLSPIGYFDKQGNDVTRKVRAAIRPPNLAFILVEARMYLGQLHSTFNETVLFTHQYYLLLPQSCQTIGSSRLERGVEDFQDSNATEEVEDTDEPGAGFFISLERTGRKPVTEVADKMKVALQVKGKTLMTVGIWTLC